MAPNFRCKFKVHWPSCLQEKKLYNPVSIFSKQARLWRHKFYDKRHFELSTGDAIMNIAVSFYLLLLKTCLICHKGVFKTLRRLFT